MCGIAGFIGLGDRATLRAMTDAISHRGPDADGHWIEEKTGVHLGHRRLSIVDLEGGAQPMWTRDGEIGVVFNGEIYNHAELRAELTAAGCQFTTDHSDTEVLLHAYRQWGDDFVERLNGMWAFVIYDRPRRRLLGSRDRFGKKPLYWFREGGTFGFASELPALAAHPSCPRSISPRALRKYFAYCFIPAPLSIYERVSKLPGGHNFSLTLDGEFKTWRWWSYLIEPDPTPTPDQWAEQLRATLERAVQRRLMSDVPLGVFLSGGIDSSAIAALAARHLPAGKLETFSIGFREKSFDESTHARLVAQHLGTKHFEETLDLDAACDLLPSLVSRLDEPMGDGSLLPTYLLSRFTRQRVTVALGGDGGDELFAGYDPMRALRPAELWTRHIPRPVHAAVRAAVALLPVSHANMSLDFKAKRFLRGTSHPAHLWNTVWMGACDPAELAELFATPVDIEDTYSEAIAAWDTCAQPNPMDRALQWWTNLYLPDGILAKVDRASMLCSLEARSPFLDLEVADLARRIPHQLKLRGGTTKWILKKALLPLLPRQIVERPKKGFGMPIGRWLRENRFDFHPERTTPLGLAAPIIHRRLTAHLAGKTDDRLYLWCQWLLEQWLPAQHNKAER